MSLYCSTKSTCIIKKNNVKRTRGFFLIVLILLEQKTNLNDIKKVYEYKYFCNFVMYLKTLKILKFNQFQILDKVLTII